MIGRKLLMLIVPTEETCNDYRPFVVVNLKRLLGSF
jgi:hypothetical protein